MRTELTKAAFDRYAPILVQVVRDWPAVTTKKPTKISVNTLAARLRDARMAKRIYKYQYPGLDDAKFTAIVDEMLICIVGDSVSIGPAEALKQIKVKPVATEPTVSAIKFNGNDAQLQSLCSLLSAGCFPLGTTFYHPSSCNIAALESQNPNIAIVPQGDGILIQ